MNEIPPPGAQRRQVCFHFLSGKCIYGDRCKFLHERDPTQTRINATDGASSKSVQAKKPQNNSKAAKGKAPAAQSSNNQPSTTRTTATASKPSAVPVTQSSQKKKKQPCFGWVDGKCDRGEGCKYSHDVPQRQGLQQLPFVFGTVGAGMVEFGNHADNSSSIISRLNLKVDEVGNNDKNESVDDASPSGVSVNSASNEANNSNNKRRSRVKRGQNQPPPPPTVRLPRLIVQTLTHQEPEKKTDGNRNGNENVNTNNQGGVKSGRSRGGQRKNPASNNKNNNGGGGNSAPAPAPVNGPLQAPTVSLTPHSFGSLPPPNHNPLNLLQMRTQTRLRGQTSAVGVVTRVQVREDMRWLEEEERRLKEESRLAREQRRLEEERRVEEERRTAEAAAAAARQREAEERERVRLADVEARQEAARRLEEAAVARRTHLAEQERIRHEHEARVTTQHMVLGSTLITCGSGLEVRGVVSGFESCRVTIRGLPVDAKPNEIVELFTQQGMSQDNVHVVSTVRIGGGGAGGRPGAGGRSEGVHLEAKVLTSAAEGRAIAEGLDGIEFRDEYLRFEVSDIVSAHSMGEGSTKQADTLTITWSAPSLSMIATYETMEEARNKARALNGRMIPGGGEQKIRAEMNQRPERIALLHLYTPESIKLTRIPMGVTIDTVREFAGTLNVRSIKSNAYNLEDLLQSFRQHLLDVPGSPLQRFTHSHERDAIGIVTIKAQFDNWEHANHALKYVQERSSHIMYRAPQFQFNLPQPHHFIMTIPLQQYEAQKTRWDELIEVVQEGNSTDAGQKIAPRIHIFRMQDRGLVRLKLSGEDKKAVGALKVRVETLAAGEKLDATCWHRSFLWQKGKEFLNRVLSKTGVYVRADIKVRALKIYGVGEAKQRARQMIEKEIASLGEEEWSVVLKRQSVGYFIRRGLDELKEVLGNDAVTLDLTSWKLTLRGGEQVRHTLDTLMKQSLDNLDVGISNPGTDLICPICYDGVANPVTLACKHSYCRACLRHYLTSAAETKIFPLACMGDESNCKRPISIPVIQQFLTSEQYEHLVSVVFSNYLEQHPQEFRYCTTPDCTQIYRADTEMMLKCPSCYAEVCSSCHEEAHEGMSCQERRLRKAEQEQLDGNWAASVGMKRCPSCNVYIEKAGGCNHMSCRCGAHICWICNQVFPGNEETYTHLRESHGGIYDNGRGPVNNNDDARIAAELQRQENARAAHIARQVDGNFLVLAGVNANQQLNAAGEAERQATLRRVEVLRRGIENQRQLNAQRAQEALQRRTDEQQARLLREAEQRHQREGGWGCTVM